MSNPYPGVPASGERWNVNMPAVIGIVFVFLVGVVVWVLVSSGADDGAAAPNATPVGSDDAAPTDPTATTTPAPMPSVATTSEPGATAGVTSPTSTSSTTSTTTTTSTSSTSTTSTTTIPSGPPTTAAGAAPGAVAGDLGIPDRPMSKPGCDGSYITVLASAIGGQATAAGIADLLDAYPGSAYLRTDQTCPSLTPRLGGEPIYVVYFGPFAVDSDACAARADGPDDSYPRMLSDDVDPDHAVVCA